MNTKSALNADILKFTTKIRPNKGQLVNINKQP